MAKYGAELPSGFTLVAPNQNSGLPEKQKYGAELPEGFTLTTPGENIQQPPGVTPATIAQRAEELRDSGVPEGEAQRQLLHEFSGNLEQDRLALASGPQTPLVPSTKEAIVGGVQAFPGSMKKQATDLYKTVSEPKKTWEGLKTLMVEGYKKQFPTPIKNVLTAIASSDIGGKLPEGVKDAISNIENTPAIDKIVDDYVKTYGDYGEFKKVLATDPVRILMDIGSVAAPAAKGAQVSALAAGLPKAAKVAGALHKGALLSEPITAATAVVKPVSKLVGVPMKFLGAKLKPTKLYQSAAKMVVKEADRTRIVQTALDEGILPDLEGLNKLDSIMIELDDKISKAIDAAQTAGTKMPVEELFKEFEALEAKFKLSGKPKESNRAINRIRRNFEEVYQNTESLPPAKVQALKRRIYKDLQGYYDIVKNSPASVDAQQAMAKASKEFLETIAPEIGAYNKRYGNLIELRKVLEKPAARIQKRAIIGIGSGAKTTIGTAIGHAFGSAEIGVIAGISFSILTDPIVQARIAVTMNKIAKEGGKISKATVANLEKIGLKQVQKAGKTIWTPGKRLAAEQASKVVEKAKDENGLAKKE